MLNTNAVLLQSNLLAMLENAIKYHETINVCTSDGNAVILSEEEYNGLLATLELSADPELREKILTGKDEPIENCVKLEEVVW